MAGLGRAHPAARPWRAPGAEWAPAVCSGDHAAHPLPAAEVEPERSVNGTRAAGLPDESTSLRFRLLLKKHQLAPQVLTTSIAEPSSTKNSSGERDPEMHQNNKGNQWTFLSGIAESTGTFA